MPSSDPNADPVPARGGAFTYVGSVHWEYSPELDHDPDPGEIVWTWVAFEEDASVGKDRPVAVVGRTDDRRHASSVRREGAILPRGTFESIVSGLQGAASPDVSGRSGKPRPRKGAPAAQGAGLFARLRRLLGR